MTEVYGVGPVVAALLIGHTGTSPDSPPLGTSPPTTAPHPSRRRQGRSCGTGSTRAATPAQPRLTLAAVTQISHDTLDAPTTAQRSTSDGKSASADADAARSSAGYSDTVYRQLRGRQRAPDPSPDMSGSGRTTRARL